MTTNPAAMPLPESEATLLSDIDALGEQMRALLDRVRMNQVYECASYHAAQHTQAERDTFQRQISEGQRWRMRAMDDLQLGMMQLKRAVTRPTTFA